jgi:cell division protein FtsW
MRIARRSADPFLRLLTATTTLWLVGQMFINVGYVVGLLPITGLQLPLISAGGSAQATTLLMMGLITNAARHEPEAVAALRAGRDDRVNRLLRLPMPEPYVPTRLESARDRLRTRKAALPAKAKAKPARKADRKPERRPERKPDRRMDRRPDRKAVANRRQPQPGDRTARRSDRTRADQPVGAASSSVRYGSGQRNQGRRARALEGQRYG